MNQISEVSLVSSMRYSDSKKIADIDTDLLRTPIESDAISNNVKNAIIATEDENFKKHKGVVPKAVLGFGVISFGGWLFKWWFDANAAVNQATGNRRCANL